MLKQIIPVLLGLAVLLTACGPQAAPTMAPADVQNTAVSAAWTMVAATQNAIPTATPQPPTEQPTLTPLPTFTPQPIEPLPTLSDFFPTPTQQGSTGSGDCLHPLNVAEAGPISTIRIENQADGSMNLSLNLWLKNPFGQCGSLSYVLAKNEKRIVKIPRGSWYAYAWITGKNGTSSTSSCSFILRIGSGPDMGRLIIGKQACHAQDV
jgi:hypothetical protein